MGFKSLYLTKIIQNFQQLKQFRPFAHYVLEASRHPNRKRLYPSGAVRYGSASRYIQNFHPSRHQGRRKWRVVALMQGIYSYWWGFLAQGNHFLPIPCSHETLPIGSTSRKTILGVEILARPRLGALKRVNVSSWIGVTLQPLTGNSGSN